MALHVSVYGETDPLLCPQKSISRTVNSLNLNQVPLKSERSTAVNEPLWTSEQMT